MIENENLKVQENMKVQENLKAQEILKVQEILNLEGWKYEKIENDILLIAAYQARKWKMVISCEGESGVCCFAVYPWIVMVDKLAKTLVALNELNLVQRGGCFMVNPTDSKVIYRYGMQILDEYTSKEYIKNVLLLSVASVNANWEKIYSIIYGEGQTW